MKIATPREVFAGEARVAMTPDSGEQLQKLGAGQLAGFSDEAYREAGVTIIGSRDDVYSGADFIANVRPPEPEEFDRMRPGQTLVSFFYPAQNTAILEKARGSGATVSRQSSHSSRAPKRSRFSMISWQLTGSIASSSVEQTLQLPWARYRLWRQTL